MGLYLGRPPAAVPVVGWVWLKPAAGESRSPAPLGAAPAADGQRPRMSREGGGAAGPRLSDLLRGRRGEGRIRVAGCGPVRRAAASLPRAVLAFASRALRCVGNRRGSRDAHMSATPAWFGRNAGGGAHKIALVDVTEPWRRPTCSRRVPTSRRQRTAT